MSSHRIKPLVITDGRHFRLRDVDPRDTGNLSLSKEEAAAFLSKKVSQLCVLQEKLYADDRWGVLLIFQAMDAAGKDGVIKHVLSGVNPQGCEVYSFKVPSAEELDHDFLWRTTRCLPERGRIGVFNRSYYEEVLVVRVHPEFLANQRLPAVTKKIWQERFEAINASEQHLAQSGYVVRKFFLHVSKEEQRQRFLKRLDEPDKRWKFSLNDVKERERWGDYMRAYEDMVRHTSSPHAPWVVVPADRKWYARAVVATAIVEALESLDLAFPQIDAGKRRELARARAELEAEQRSRR